MHGTTRLLYDMIYTQPVVYELGALKPDTLLIIGDKDTTAIGKDLAPPDIQRTLGNYRCWRSKPRPPSRMSRWCSSLIWDTRRRSRTRLDSMLHCWVG